MERGFSMKKAKYTDEQIAFSMQQNKAGKSVADISRKLGIAELKLYRWKKRFALLEYSHTYPSSI